MKSLRSFFGRIRQAYFRLRLEREIYHQIFPHLENEHVSDYPFSSDEELLETIERAGFDAQRRLKLIAQLSEQMPKAYGEAFRYIAYRDLNERMEMYLRLARRRVQPKSIDPRFVATQAS